MNTVTDKLTAATGCCAAGLTGALDKTRSAVAGAREHIAHSVPVTKAREGARVVNDYAHKSPWALATGIAAVALAVGFLLRRR